MHRVRTVFVAGFVAALVPIVGGVVVASPTVAAVVAGAVVLYYVGKKMERDASMVDPRSHGTAEGLCVSER